MKRIVVRTTLMATAVGVYLLTAQAGCAHRAKQAEEEARRALAAGGLHPTAETYAAGHFSWAPSDKQVVLHPRQESRATVDWWKREYAAVVDKRKYSPAWAYGTLIVHKGWEWFSDEIGTSIPEDARALRGGVAPLRYHRKHQADPQSYPYPRMFVGLGAPFSDDRLHLYECSPPREFLLDHEREESNQIFLIEEDSADQPFELVYRRDDGLVMCGSLFLTALIHSQDAPRFDGIRIETYQSTSASPSPGPESIPEQYQSWRASLSYLDDREWKYAEASERPVERIDVYWYFPEHGVGASKQMVINVLTSFRTLSIPMATFLEDRRLFRLHRMPERLPEGSESKPMPGVDQ